MQKKISWIRQDAYIEIPSLEWNAGIYTYKHVYIYVYEHRLIYYFLCVYESAYDLHILNQKGDYI